MAKGKNAAALFEVMDRSKGSGGGGSDPVMRTPRWWSKRAAATAGSMTAPASSIPGEPMMRVDRDHQMVQFSLSTSTSLVIVFGVVVVIGLAYALGDHVGRKHAPMTAITSEDLLKSSPNPQVMQVPAGSNSPTDHSETNVSDEQPAPPPSEAAPAEQAPTSADRQVGLNYVIMQSYPPDMRSLATEAQTALLLHGVPCTIENAPARLRLGKEWISVIGTTGFKSISGSEFNAYRHKIEAANAELHGKFKKLRPLAYKWR